MIIKKYIIYFLDENDKVISKWITQRKPGSYITLTNQSELFDWVCEREKADKNKKFLIEVICKGCVYYYYNDPLINII